VSERNDNKVKKVKHLYKGIIKNFCEYGGKVIVMYVHAYTEAQAKKLIALKFNKRYGFVLDAYVDMDIILIKKKEKGGDKNG